MRRRPLHRSAALAAALLLTAVTVTTTACDVWGAPTWAARVGDTEITLDDMEAVATAIDAERSSQGQPELETNEGPGRQDGATNRDALGLIVQWELAREALDQLGEDVPAAARDQVDQSLPSTLEGETRARILEGLAATQTLGAVLADHLDAPLIVDFVADFYDAQVEAVPGYWDGWRCVEGVAAIDDGRAEVERRLDEGESLEEIAGAAPEGVGPLFQTTATSCLPESDFPPDLLAQVEATPEGEVVVYETQGQTGETVTYFLRVLEVVDIEKGDPQVVDVIARSLQQQQGQQLLVQLLTRVAEDTEIAILPTLGSDYDVSQLIVVPPPFPLPPKAETGDLGGLGGADELGNQP